MDELEKEEILREVVISDDEIAQTLQALRESSMEIPDDLHVDVQPVLDDAQALKQALEEQERLREELRRYKEKEQEAENFKELVSLALHDVKEHRDLSDGETGVMQGDVGQEVQPEPTFVRVSTTGQVVDEEGNVIAVDRRSKTRTEENAARPKRRITDSIRSQMIRGVVIPVMIVIVLLIGALSFLLYRRAQDEVQMQLKESAAVVQNMFDAMYGEYPGLYSEKNAYAVYLGEHVLNESDSLLLDRIKEDTGMDLSYIYANTRILTTLRDNEGVRMAGSTVSAKLLDEVAQQGERFYSNVKIEDQLYYAYYRTILDENGLVCGMLALALPEAVVGGIVAQNILPALLFLLIALASLIFVTFRYSQKMTGLISSVESFMKRVAAGNLSATLSSKVLGRKDEFGSMGKSIVSMQSSLRELIEKDALTTLPNRRYADKQLRSIQDKSRNSGAPFALAIADIDFFKKVNDTYGHECGDVVLKQTALLLKKGMRGHGFASRWGGEEFLLVFDGMDEYAAAKVLNQIRLEIGAQTIYYDDMTVRRTMSFGVTTGDSDVDGDMLLMHADECLYEAKESGRNRVITYGALQKKKESEAASGEAVSDTE